MKITRLFLGLLALFAIGLRAQTPVPHATTGVAVDPNGVPRFLQLDSLGHLLLASGTGFSGKPAPQNFSGIAVDPWGRPAFLQVDSTGALLTSGGDGGTWPISGTPGIVVTLGALANSAGVLTNNGTGGLSWGAGSGTGTVTSVSGANGLSGTVTTSGSISGVDAVADGATKGVAAFTAADFDAAVGVISLDYTNAQKATGSVPGFLTAADWTTFNGKQGGNAILTTLAGLANASGVLTNSGTGALSWATAGGTGTVTSVAASTGLTGGTITTSGTIALDQAVAVPITANAMGALAIDVTKRLNTKSISTDSSFTFSGTPATANTPFSLKVVNTDTNAHALTIPSSVSIQQGTNITAISIPASSTMVLTWLYDGSNYVVAGDPALSTGTGNFVRATSPTLVTPILGTPQSGALGSCTAYPVSALASAGTGVLTALGVNTNAAGGVLLASATAGIVRNAGAIAELSGDATTTGSNAVTVVKINGGSMPASAALLASNASSQPTAVTAGTGVVTALGVNVGTAGAVVVNGGALGTPSGGTLTSCSGLPIAGIASLGTGVGTALAVNNNAAGGYSPIDGTATLSNKRITPRVGGTTSSATPTINTDNYDIYELTAQSGDITNMSTNLTGTPSDGDQIELRITGTAARAITWSTKWVAGPVALPTTTVTTKTLYVFFEFDSVVTHWVCMFSGSLP